MLFEILPNLLAPAVAGAWLGTPVVVSETESEILTRFPPKLARV